MNLRESVADAFKVHGIWEGERLDLANTAILAMFDYLAANVSEEVLSRGHRWENIGDMDGRFRGMIEQAKLEYVTSNKER